MDDLLAGAEVASIHTCPIRPVVNRSLSSLKLDGSARNSPEEFLSTDIERGGSNPWSSPASPWWLWAHGSGLRFGTDSRLAPSSDRKDDLRGRASWSCSTHLPDVAAMCSPSLPPSPRTLLPRLARLTSRLAALYGGVGRRSSSCWRYNIPSSTYKLIFQDSNLADVL